MYGEIVEDLRDGLAVSAEQDGKLLRGLKKAAKQLLQIYNFRDSVRRAVLPILASENNVTLPADLGKIKRVVLTTVEGTSTLYKVLRRKDEGQLPTYAGPNFYFIEGSALYIDSKMPAILATPYNIEIWYQSESADFCENWLSAKYDGPLEHLAGAKLALKMRKPEAAEIYGALWQQDTVILGKYTSELEFGDLDIVMGNGPDTPSLERYPAG